MTTTQRLIEFALAAVPLLALIFVARPAWRRLFTAMFRADLFSLRRELFCLQWQERLKDENAIEAYDRLRQTLNGMLFEAEKITWFHIAVGMAWARLRHREALNTGTFEAIDEVTDPELRRELNRIHKHMSRAIMRHLMRLIWVTPPMYPLYFYLRVKWLPKALFEMIGFTSAKPEVVQMRAAA